MALTTLFPATRWSLVRRLDCSQAPIGELLIRYLPAIRAYLRRRFAGCDPSHCDDLTQEVLARLLEEPAVLARAAADPGRPFRAWLMRVAWNLARNARRRLQGGDRELIDHAAAAAAFDAAAAPVAATEERELDAAWARGLIDCALDDLRGWQAEGHLAAPAVEILCGSLFEGAGIRALADRHGLSRATAGRRLVEARHALIRALVDHLQAAGELDHQAEVVDAQAVLLAAAGRNGT